MRRAAVGGVLWTGSSQGLRQILQVGITAVLARHLLAEDFGLIAMVAVSLAFVAPFNELGMGAALVQRKTLMAGHCVTVFWFQVIVASATAAGVALAAPFIAGFFGRHELVPLLRVMCLNLPVGAAASVPQALLLRDLRFGRVAWVETASLAGSGALAIIMAISGWGLWSLVGQALCGAAMTTLMLLPLARFNPLSALPRMSHVRDLAGFSTPLAGYQLLNFISRNIDDILVGRFLGAEALGYYSMAYRMMMYPLQKVSGVVGRVSFPMFSSIQDDMPRIRHGYLKAVQYIALITFPMMAAVMVAAPELTRLLFGPSWDPVAPLIMVLSLAGMSGSIGTTTGSIFLARGRSDLQLKWEILVSACHVITIAAGLPWGVMGVAIGHTLMSLILWPLTHRIANRLIDLSLSRLYKALVPPAVLAALLGAAILGLRLLWSPADPLARMAFLAACAAIGSIIFLGSALLGRPAVVVEVVGLARESFSRVRWLRQGEVP